MELLYLLRSISKVGNLWWAVSLDLRYNSREGLGILETLVSPRFTSTVGINNLPPFSKQKLGLKTRCIRLFLKPIPYSPEHDLGANSSIQGHDDVLSSYTITHMATHEGSRALSSKETRTCS